MDEVGGDQLFARITQIALQVGLGGLFEFGVDLFDGGVALRAEGQVDDETVGVGTRKDMPVSLPLTSGIARPTALAAPVVEGMMLIAAARPPRQSFLDGPSTVFWVDV